MTSYSQATLLQATLQSKATLKLQKTLVIYKYKVKYNKHQYILIHVIYLLSRETSVPQCQFINDHARVEIIGVNCFPPDYHFPRGSAVCPRILHRYVGLLKGSDVVHCQTGAVVHDHHLEPVRGEGPSPNGECTVRKPQVVTV